ncbi:MAG: hypothetical protein M1536_07805 [Firmicutes bacterium]|nr:hypothetical protein [Bacillota bacterium]
MKKITIAFNIVLTFALIGLSIVAYLWPEWLPVLHLNFHLSQLIIIALICLLLFMAALQKNLSKLFRVFCAFGASIVFIELAIQSLVYFKILLR